MANNPNSKESLSVEWLREAQRLIEAKDYPALETRISVELANGLLSDATLNTARALRLDATVIYLATLGNTNLPQPNDRAAWLAIYQTLSGNEATPEFASLPNASPLKKLTLGTISRNEPLNLDLTNAEASATDWLQTVELAHDLKQYDLLLQVINQLVIIGLATIDWLRIGNTLYTRYKLNNSIITNEKFGYSLRAVAQQIPDDKDCGSARRVLLTQSNRILNKNDTRKPLPDVSPLILADETTEADISANWTQSLEQPVVTIKCLTYNHVSYIKSAIDGFLCQRTDFPFNIVIHDDASTDGTIAVLEQYKQRFPHIIQLIIQNTNQYSKGNKIKMDLDIMPYLTGKYVATCEGDDYWTDTHKLQKQHDYLEQHADVSVTCHDSYCIDKYGGFLGDTEPPKHFKCDFNSFQLLTKQAWITVRTLMYRNILNPPPSFYRVHNRDSFLTSLLGEHGGSHFHTDIKPAAYRVHDQGVWSKLTEEQKMEARLNTDICMYSYHKQQGHKKVSDHIWNRFINHAIFCHRKYHV